MKSLPVASVRLRLVASVSRAPWLCRLGAAVVTLALSVVAWAQLPPDRVFDDDAFIEGMIAKMNRNLVDQGYDPYGRSPIPDDVLARAREKAQTDQLASQAGPMRILSAIVEWKPATGVGTTVAADASTLSSGTPRQSTFVGSGSALQSVVNQVLDFADDGSSASSSPRVTPRVLLGFPAAANNTVLTAVAGNGSVAFGWYATSTSPLAQPFFVNLPAGQPTLLPLPAGDAQAIPVGITPDGTVVAGTSYLAGDRSTVNCRIVRWSLRTVGFTVVDAVSVFGATRTVGAGLSADGNVIVGHSVDTSGRKRAYRWSATAGLKDLGTLSGQTNSEAAGTTNDGSTVVGTSGQAFAWTAAGGMQPLRAIAGSGRAVANAIAPNGVFMAGASYDANLANGIAQLWTRGGEAIKVRDLLAASGVDVTGWELNSIDRIVTSADGTYTFVGNGLFNGAPRGFVFFWLHGSGAAPVISTQPQAQVATPGGSAVLNVGATGATGYQWRRNGTNLPGATNATLTLPNVQVANAGSYSVVVSNAGGNVVSQSADVTVTSSVSRLTNVSVRTTAGTGANTLIVGFTLGGGSKNVLLRAVGPTLGTFGVTGTLDDPRLALFNGAGTQTAQNDDWGGSAALNTVFDSVGAFRLPAASKDAVLLSVLDAGGYTAQVSGSGGASGIVLLEAYDSDAGSPRARYTNLSARNQVGTGGSILIVGFNVTGNAPLPLLIRGVGPGLNQFGLTGALADPQLAIFNSAGAQVNRNDDWGGSAALTAAFNSVGAFGLTPTSKDSALSVTLQPGSYTAQVSGVGNTTGLALVEIYALP